MHDVISRRSFAALGLSSLASLALASRLRGQDAAPAAEAGETPLFLDWSEPKPGVRVASAQGGNSLLLRGPSGKSILIDTKNPGFGTTLRREAESFGSAVEMAFITHHHRDHIGGNGTFTKDTPLVGHANTKQRILDQIDQLVSSTTRMVGDMDTSRQTIPPLVRREVTEVGDWITRVNGNEFVPTRLIDKPEETINVAGLDVVLRHFGNGHTDNDLVVFIPSMNILHTGDLLFHKRHPFIDRAAGSSTRAWQGVLAKVAELCDDATVVIPGHGEVCNKAALAEQSSYFDKAREIIRHAKNVEGMSKIEVGGLNPGAFGDYGLTQIRPRTFTAIYEEIEEEEAGKAK